MKKPLVMFGETSKKIAFNPTIKIQKLANNFFITNCVRLDRIEVKIIHEDLPQTFT